ncbi:MAG: methyltransferase [Pirellulaceae bacterium]|nr:methyltransferase [Pirellulaceae bacterium]
MSHKSSIDAFLERLHAEGQVNDNAAPMRSDMRLNITPSTGAFLDLMITDAEPKRILELGTSNGYSTIWIARAADRIAADFESVEISAKKSKAADENLRATGLRDSVSLRTGDCGEFLARSPDAHYDFVFLDCDRGAYRDWAFDLLRTISFGTLVVDNAVSHASELVDLQRYVGDDDQLASVVLPIGKGQLVVRRR